MPPGYEVGSPNGIVPPGAIKDEKSRVPDMLRPVSAVAVSVPTRSCWLESSKTLSVSTCCASGGCGAMLKTLALPSPGSRIAGRSERSEAVVPPSTASGPRMPLRRCWRFEKLLRSPRSGARSNHGSATIGTSTGWYQLLESKVTTAAHWVRVTTPVPVDGSALGWLVILRTSSLLAVVPKIASILKRALDVLSL